MAKGDANRSQNQIDKQSQIAQTGLSGLQNEYNQQYQQYSPQFQESLDSAKQDYGNIMGGYQNYMQGLAPQYADFKSGLAKMQAAGGGAGLSNQNEVNSALAGYQNFADTGGYSANDLQAFRQQNLAPVRAAYNQADAALQQGRGLSGGYSPNFAAAQSQMARQQGQGMANAAIGSNAAIGNLVQQGKLAGLGGLSQTALQNQAEALQASALNNQYNLGVAGLGLQGLEGYNQGMLGGLEGQRGLYSAVPGQAGLLSQHLTNLMQGQGQNQALQNQLSLGTMNAQNQKGLIPGDFQQGISNASGILGLTSSIAKGLGMIPWGGSPKGGGTGGVTPGGMFPNYDNPNSMNYPFGNPGMAGSNIPAGKVDTEWDYRVPGYDNQMGLGG